MLSYGCNVRTLHVSTNFGLAWSQDQEASARALQDLQHLDGCVFEANRRLRVAEEYAQGAEGEAEGVEGVLGRLRDQVRALHKRG